MDFIKVTTFSLGKALFKGWKDKLRTGRKYLQSTCPTKDQCQEYIKNSQTQLQKKKNTTIQLENGQNDMNRYFTQKYIQIANKYIKTLPISLAIIREMKTKTTVTYLPIRKFKMKENSDNTKCW